MPSSKAKTQGYQWVELSLIAFNGSGYANRESAELFLQSYIHYKGWKKDSEAVQLAEQYSEPLLELSEYLIETSNPSKTPSDKGYRKFTNWIEAHHNGTRRI